MTGKGQFIVRRQDAKTPMQRLALNAGDEHCFAQIELARDGLHLSDVEITGIRKHRERIAAEADLREYVVGDERKFCHFKPLEWEPLPRSVSGNARMKQGSSLSQSRTRRCTEADPPLQQQAERYAYQHRRER